MESGDLLNILLIIAFAVGAPLLSLFGKKGTKTQKSSEPDSEAQGFNFPDHPGSDDTKAQEQAAPGKNQAYIYSDKDINNKNYQINEAYKQINAQNTSKSDELMENGKNDDFVKRGIKQSLSQDISKNTLSKPSSKASKIARGFDIKKAVIFSEILNTKYF